MRRVLIIIMQFRAKRGSYTRCPSNVHVYMALLKVVIILPMQKFHTPGKFRFLSFTIDTRALSIDHFNNILITQDTILVQHWLHNATVN